MTHTVAELEISFGAYAEIRAKLIQAGYMHVEGAIDMTGIAIAPPAGTVKHDQIACSLTNGRGLNCTCDAYDSPATAAALSTETVDNPVETAPLTNAARDVLAERVRQKEIEWWTPEHDDLHTSGELAEAAAAYASEAARSWGGLPGGWPWAAKWWKPGTPRRNLVKAGALILAEIERLDRASEA
ncbi:hypothetical protein Q8F57_003435 [Paraburkholderia terrae]|uniref:hypothetical protein n=1 Tax=Paraburkholderia terrae TaxID=311230 RepID=UPI00296ACC92|nr:hypothetical protein [Paraburkholderia terrae]MDW3655421.1 hypothetical protein [Paraburkholderia terrae]